MLVGTRLKQESLTPGEQRPGKALPCLGGVHSSHHVSFNNIVSLSVSREKMHLG